METGDKVKSSLSLWSGDVGTISGIIQRKDDKNGDLVHVLFPETDTHYGYQQSFNSKDLIVVESKLQNEIDYLNQMDSDFYHSDI